MNGTLVFGGDRFGPDQDYAATYRSLGGSELAPAVVKAIVQTCYNTMGAIYDDPSRSGVLECFRVMIFSSDGSSLKPSRKLFDQAIAAVGVPRSGAVFVGDNLRCDIGGARGAGLASVWIDRDRRGLQPGDPQPDFIVNDLREILDA